ncbi:hypothetical protein P8452_54447 [Trifolium repens]|nr:hypothetical protein P8452_54447 [Trifolium repens]
MLEEEPALLVMITGEPNFFQRHSLCFTKVSPISFNDIPSVSQSYSQGLEKSIHYTTNGAYTIDRRQSDLNRKYTTLQ